MNDTFICSDCGVSAPRREGRVYDRWVGTCRACRARECGRNHMRCKRENDKLKAVLVGRSLRLTTISKEAAIEDHLRLIGSAYLKATAVTRTRIRLMEKVENPKRKTLKALVVRRALLDKYSEAYQQQQATVRAGGKIVHIQDMIQE